MTNIEPEFEIGNYLKLKPIQRVRMLRNEQGESYPDPSSVPVIRMPNSVVDDLLDSCRRAGMRFVTDRPTLRPFD